jgi:hypothetical protein
MNPLIYKLSIRYGLLIGGISAVFSIILYLVNPLLQFTNFVIPILSFVIVIALLVVLALDVRKQTGGYWNFGQAFVSLITMSVLITVIGLLVSFIIMKFVDPTLPTKINDAMADVTSQRLEKLGMSQEDIDKSTKMFTNGEFIAKLQPSIKNELVSFAGAIAFYAIIDLIIAACVKKKQPMFSPVSDTETIE